MGTGSSKLPSAPQRSQTVLDKDSLRKNTPQFQKIVSRPNQHSTVTETICTLNSDSVYKGPKRTIKGNERDDVGLRLPEIKDKCTGNIAKTNVLDTHLSGRTFLKKHRGNADRTLQPTSRSNIQILPEITEDSITTKPTVKPERSFSVPSVRYLEEEELFLSAHKPLPPIGSAKISQKQVNKPIANTSYNDRSTANTSYKNKLIPHPTSSQDNSRPISISDTPSEAKLNLVRINESIFELLTEAINQKSDLDLEENINNLTESLLFFDENPDIPESERTDIINRLQSCRNLIEGGVLQMIKLHEETGEQMPLERMSHLRTLIQIYAR